MARGIEYWATGPYGPHGRILIQTPSFRKALHTAVEKAEKSGDTIIVEQYERDETGFWNSTGDVWKIKVS